MISVLNDQLLATTDGNKAYFVNYDNPSGRAELDGSKSFGKPNKNMIKSMHLANNYVLIVYEYSVLIYDKFGTLLQEISADQLNPPTRGTKFRYTDGCVNPVGDNTEIVLHCENQLSDRQMTQTLLIILREKNVEDQIEQLLHMLRIPEAIQVLNTRLTKNTDNYFRIRDKFDLDAGWVLLTEGEPENAKKHLQTSNVDPRELILLFDDLRDAVSPTF